MSLSESQALGPLARRDDEPVFDEPWQAQVLALAFNLIAQDVFSAGQWSDALGAELKHALARREPDDPQTYYRSALAALETLLAADGRIVAERLADRVETWRRAYLNTPHGQPVKLSAGAGPEIRHQ
ncbi:MAG: nitrile hydratase accessory protein [Gammaproteobacteria bacterium]|nr:nitrile hydratase accessory protein [Gammaproteobacteria bacterium]